MNFKGMVDKLNEHMTAEEWEKRDVERRKLMEARFLRLQRQAVDQLDCGLLALETIRSGLMLETAAVKAIMEPGTIIVLGGAPGTGKTVAGARWLERWIMDPTSWVGPDTHFPRLVGSPMFVTAALLSRWPRYEEGAMNKILRAPRLVIDDMGVEFMDANGSYLALLDELINERYTNSRPTVMTTNLAVGAFATRYGGRIADRIRQSGRFESVGNKSLRGKP